VGIALKNSGRTAEALRKFELARYYHQKSRHRIYLGTVENNLAQLYKVEKRFAEAHERRMPPQESLNEKKTARAKVSRSIQKRKFILPKEKYAEALKAIEKAIEILKKSENSAYLSESYLTKAKILLYSDGFTVAALALYEAVKIAEINIGEAAVRNLITEFEDVLSEKNKPVASLPNEETGEEKLELIMPASLMHYDEIQVVRINNQYLENVGLPKDSLAVVAQIEVNRGDLAVVSETASDRVVCGFYDAYFGIVCLEAKSGDPYLFDENEITILGKIVGVCSSGKTSGGKLIVEPLKF
jgi:tetratricopeptide (TPR) repeat protein